MDIQIIAQEMRPVIYQAGEIALSYFRNVGFERKADQSVVTAADKDVENFLRQEITSRYPDHGFIGEETGKHQVDTAEYAWAVDPIDGTEPFICELPIWCVSVGMVHREGPKIGFVYLPVLNDLFWAVDGGPAYLNDEVIHVREPGAFHARSTILAASVTYPRYFDVQYPGRCFAFGSAAANLCYTAKGGKIEAGMVDYIRIYDIAGGAMLIKAAGGVLRYLNGDDVCLWDMLDGEKAKDCMVFGHPENVEVLRNMFVEKAKVNGQSVLRETY